MHGDSITPCVIDAHQQ